MKKYLLEFSEGQFFEVITDDIVSYVKRIKRTKYFKEFGFLVEVHLVW